MDKIHINLPTEMKRQLKFCALSAGQSMNALVLDMLERCLKQEIKKEAA